MLPTDTDTHRALLTRPTKPNNVYFFCLLGQTKCAICSFLKMLKFWQRRKTVLWIMLNPSTATQSKDDNTTSKCVSFSRNWGYDRMVVINLFSYKSTEQKGLKEAFKNGEPINENDEKIREKVITNLKSSDRIVVAWGNGPAKKFRDDVMKPQIDKLMKHAIKPNCEIRHLGLTDENEPKHPLARDVFLDTEPRPYDPLDPKP